MPSSIVDALLSGSTPTDEDKLNAMSNSLRQNKEAADLFSLSTIKPISQAAVRSGQDTMTAAKRIGTLREARERREEAARLKEMELAQEQARYAIEDQQWAAEEALKKQIADEKLAAKTGGAPKMGITDTRGYRLALKAYKNLPELMKDVERGKDAFGMMSSTEPLLPDALPNAARVIAEGLNSKRFTREQLETRARVYRMSYELIHALAGATLGAGEATRLNPFIPKPGDTLDQIQSKLKGALRVAKEDINSYEEFYRLPRTIQEAMGGSPEAAGIPKGKGETSSSAAVDEEDEEDGQAPTMAIPREVPRATGLTQAAWDVMKEGDKQIVMESLQ